MLIQETLNGRAVTFDPGKLRNSMRAGKMILIFGLLSLPGLAFADCASNGGGQADLNQCYGSEYRKADSELNALYKKILSEYADDPRFIEKFKAAQRAWIKFRDAEMEALFPHGDEPQYYGSVYPMCDSIWLTTLTRERIDQLRKWSKKTEEGDVCSGSIKIKQ